MTADAIQLIRDNNPETNLFKFQFEELKPVITGEFLIPEDAALSSKNQYLIIENKNMDDQGPLTIIDGDNLKAVIPQYVNPR